MKLRVATYNIHKGVMGLRKKSRIHDVRVALHSIDADIVFLQEVQDRNERLAKRFGHANGTQLDYLCTGSYLHRAYGMNAVYPHGHHGNAIVSRHAIGRYLNHDISDHMLEKRGMLHAVSHIETRRKGAIDIHLINTHFGLIKRSRVRQAAFLVDFVNSEIEPEAPLIIAGDFNDWQRGVDEVLQSELDVVEVAAEFNRELAQPRLFDRLMPWREPRRKPVARTYPSVLPWLMLDRIYVRGFRVKDVRVPKGVEWAQRSDHMPLIADLEVA
jgi:endonuclease/exonuclease/phosphatase family metal-dependent hydrolase